MHSHCHGSHALLVAGDFASRCFLLSASWTGIGLLQSYCKSSTLMAPSMCRNIGASHSTFQLTVAVDTALLICPFVGIVEPALYAISPRLHDMATHARRF